MARKAGKAKSRKVAARKPAVRSARKVSKFTRQEIKSAGERALDVSSKKVKLSFPCKMMLSKGAERLPLEVKDAAHHDRLVQEFGEACLEVMS